MANEQTIQMRLRMVSDFSDVATNVSQIQRALKQIQLPPNLKNSVDDIFTDLERETKKYQRFLDSGLKKKSDITGLEASGTRISSLLKRLQTDMKKIDPSMLEKSFQVDPGKLQALESRIASLRTSLGQLMQSNPLQQFVQQAQTAANEISKMSKTKFIDQFMKAFKDGDVDAAAQALEKLRKNHKAFQDQAQEERFTPLLGTLQTLLNKLAQNPAFKKITGELEATNQQLVNLHSDELIKLVNAFSQGIGDVSDFRNQFKLLNDELVGGANKQHEFNSELQMLKTRVTYFFGLTNSVQLFKRAITQALNTVKELDATMTEAAVVTDFSVGDMWDKLPQYADQAQKLGVSINGLYQATTLYYQQGLKTEAAMKLGVETMKMAKVAGIESSEATKAMTAALRGFNMELNETSAINVNDVYSKLAAITAADTNQIATAMSKTASIAAGANMEFETTAALLAQIIETTQEAPETAGTALKTIIARFSEVKSLRSQGQSSGKDEEGEEIDVNRIQTALRTVGISMDGFFAGTEGLDSILLKLAEKWNTLDFETQRYIATMAAGSRQQSRFIAMMSDYGRTTELVNAANNSAGASQAQYNKTLDSMESKLQRLKNAWNEFLMGLSNNTVLKAGIDILTFVINGINKLIDLVSGGNGLTKSFASLITVVGGLAVGKRLLTGMLGEVARKTGLSTKKSDDGEETSAQKIEQSQQQAGQKSGEIGQQAGQNFGQQYVSGAVSAIQSGQGQIQQAMQQAGGVTTPQNDSSSKKFTGKVSQRRHLQPSKKIPRTVLGTPKTAAQGPKTAAEAASDEAAAKNKLSSANERLANTEEEVVSETADTTGAMDDGTNAAKKHVKTIGDVTDSMRAVGGAMMGTGAILGMLASLLEEMGETKLAEVVSVIAAAFMGFGAILTVLPSLINAFGTTAVSTGWAVQAAWWWLLVIAAVIVTIIALVYVLCKAFEAASDAAQFEKMSEQLSDLSAAADEAKEKLEAIADTRKELEQMGETFKTLTKGSREWKEALIENNSQVLELLNTYPELAKHIKTGLYGQMEITDLGWDTILESQQQAYANAYTAQTAQAQLVADKSMSMKVEQIAGEAVGKKFQMSLAEFLDSGWGKAGTIAGAMLLGPATPLSDPMLWGGLGSALAFGTPSPEEVEKEQLGLTYDQYADYAAAVAEKGLSFATSEYGELETVFKEMGFKGDFEDVYSSMRKLGQSFDELAQEAHAAKLAEEARVKAIISSNAQTSEVVQDSEYSEAIQDFTSQQYENYAELTQKAASEWEYKEGSGTDNEKNAALITAYAEATGMIEDEIRGKIKDESLSYATMAATVGSDEVNKEMIQSMEALANGLERVDKGKTKKDMSLITGLMSEGGLGLTQKDLEKIKGDDLKKFLMDTYGFKDEELTDTQMAIFEQNRKAAQEGLNNAYVYSESILGKETPIKGIINDLNKDFVSLGVSSGLSISQVQALANTLTDIAVRGGDAQETTELFGQMMEGIGSQNAELAQGIIAETDWSDELSIRSAVDSLRELGAQIDNTLISEVLQATRATRDFDLKNMTDQINKAKGVLNTIEGKKSDFSKTYTEEEKNDLKEYGYTDKDFVWAGPDEYIFLGDTNALLEDIRTQVTAIADETLKGQRDSLQKGIRIEGFLSGLRDDSNLKSWLMGESPTLDLGPTKKARKAQSVEASLDALREYYKDYYKDENLTGDQIDNAIVNDLRLGWNDLGEEAQGAFNAVGDYVAAEGMDLNNNDIISEMTGLIEEYKQDKKTVEWNPSRAELERVAKGFGMTDKEIAGQTDAQLKERVRNDINTYYKDLDKNMKNYFSGLDEASEITMYQVLGTSDVTGAQKEVTSTQKALAESETDFYYRTSHGEDRKAEEYEIVPTSGLELAKLIAQGRVDAWGTGGTENVSESMLRDLASEMGIEGTSEMGEQTLLKLIGEAFWANFTIDEEGNAVERLDVTMDAYIGSHTGLAMAVENSVEQLRAEESAAANDTLAVKNLAVAVNKTGEAMDGLNGVLKDEAEFLELNDEYNQQYRSALEKTATMAQLVFGKQVTAEFVAENRKQFIQLTKGGAEAEEAYYKIGQAAVEAEMKARGYTEATTKDAVAIMNQYISNVKPGETIDLTLLQGALNEAIGMTAEASAQMVDLFGFSISYSVETDSYIATRESAIGTGVNAFDSGDKDVWENPYDMLYNTLERINEAIREREKLERRYQRLLKSEDVSGQKIVENLHAQTEQLQEEANLQNDVVVARKQQMQDLVDQKGLSQYAWIEDGKLRIDWGAIDKISDSDRGEEVEEYISQLEEWRDSLNEAEDRLEEIQDEVQEINDTGKEEYMELEQAIADALQESYQKQIDKLSDINDSINDANSRLIESIQSTIEKDRQERKNNETEQNIVDKQQQLAYLRQDTSGANALDILKLQEEIEQSQQDYTDTLIDQKISALQEQNEKAAEQRERQIEIAQQQLDQYVATGQHWSTVEELIQSGTTETGKLLKSSELVTLLAEANSFQGMSKLDKMIWMQDLETDVSAAWAWMQKHGQYIVNAGTQNNPDLGNVKGYNYNKSSGDEVSGDETNTIKRLQKMLSSEGLYSGKTDGSYGSQSKKAVLAYQKKYGLIQNDSNYQSVIKDYESRHTYEGIVGKSEPSNKGSVQSGRLPGSHDKYGSNFTVDENGVSHITNQKVLAKQLTGDENAEVIYVPLWGGNIPKHLEKNRGRYFGLTKYKTGGLADYTGPAWLDGTKSKPELVLNARDTQNFIQLKDILGSLMGGSTKSTENSRVTNFDIDINVETVKDETDLEMIANYIENKIITSASYRNNNLIRSTR